MFLTVENMIQTLFRSVFKFELQKCQFSIGGKLSSLEESFRRLFYNGSLPFMFSIFLLVREESGPILSRCVVSNLSLSCFPSSFFEGWFQLR